MNKLLDTLCENAQKNEDLCLSCKSLYRCLIVEKGIPGAVIILVNEIQEMAIDLKLLARANAYYRMEEE